MQNRQTGDRVSSIAGRLGNMNEDMLLALTATPESRRSLAADIRSMAASLRSQDQHKGLRGFIRKVTGR